MTETEKERNDAYWRGYWDQTNNLNGNNPYERGSELHVAYEAGVDAAIVYTVKNERDREYERTFDEK